MFQEKIDELGQKTCPQEAPETIFETQGRGQYTPQMASLRKEHLSNGGWTKSEYQSGPDRIVKSSEVAYPLKAWPLQRRAAIALVFEDPFLRNLQVMLCELDQRCRLARNRVFLALLFRGHSSVDRRQLHQPPPPSACHRPGA